MRRKDILSIILNFIAHIQRGWAVLLIACFFPLYAFSNGNANGEGGIVVAPAILDPTPLMKPELPPPMQSPSTRPVLPVLAHDVAGLDVGVKDQTMTMHQTIQHVVADCNSFNIAKDHRVDLIQPNSQSMTVFRIHGSSGISTIDGVFKANGSVYLLNSNGLLIGESGMIDMRTFVATTHSDFRVGVDVVGNTFVQLQGLPNPEASIENRGTIRVGDTGVAAFASPMTRNYGSIFGRAAFVAGQKTTLTLDGSDIVQFEVSGELERTIIEQKGRVVSTGKEVLLSTSATEKFLDTHMINMDGEVIGSKITIRGGENSQVTIGPNARLDATGDIGGEIRVLGDDVTLKSGAVLDASGDHGGGRILIGGNKQGEGPEKNAQTLTVEEGVKMDANSRVSGDGGTIINYADGTSLLWGIASASALGETGNGGFIEYSGKNYLNFAQDKKHAPKLFGSKTGKGGTFLIDPTDVTINSSNTSYNSSAPGVTTVGASWIVGLLTSNTNVQINASNSITVSNPITIGADTMEGGGFTSLTFTAPFININADIIRSDQAGSRGLDIYINAQNITTTLASGLPGVSIISQRLFVDGSTYTPGAFDFSRIYTPARNFSSKKGGVAEGGYTTYAPNGGTSDSHILSFENIRFTSSLTVSRYSSAVPLQAISFNNVQFDPGADLNITNNPNDPGDPWIMPIYGNGQPIQFLGTATTAGTASFTGTTTTGANPSNNPIALYDVVINNPNTSTLTNVVFVGAGSLASNTDPISIKLKEPFLDSLFTIPNVIGTNTINTDANFSSGVLNIIGATISGLGGANITIGGVLDGDFLISNTGAPKLFIDTPGSTVTLALSSTQDPFAVNGEVGVSDTSTLVIRDLGLSATTPASNDISILGTSGGLVATYPRTNVPRISPFVGSVVQGFLNGGGATISITGNSSLTVAGVIEASFNTPTQASSLTLSAPTVVIAADIYNSTSYTTTQGSTTINAYEVLTQNNPTIQTTHLTMTDANYGWTGRVDLSGATLNVSGGMSVINKGSVILGNLNLGSGVAASNAIGHVLSPNIAITGAISLMPSSDTTYTGTLNLGGYSSSGVYDSSLGTSITTDIVRTTSSTGAPYLGPASQQGSSNYFVNYSTGTAPTLTTLNSSGNDYYYTSASSTITSNNTSLNVNALVMSYIQGTLNASTSGAPTSATIVGAAGGTVNYNYPAAFTTNATLNLQSDTVKINSGVTASAGTLAILANTLGSNQATLTTLPNVTVGTFTLANNSGTENFDLSQVNLVANKSLSITTPNDGSVILGNVTVKGTGTTDTDTENIGIISSNTITLTGHTVSLGYFYIKGLVEKTVITTDVYKDLTGQEIYNLYGGAIINYSSLITLNKINNTSNSFIYTSGNTITPFIAGLIQTSLNAGTSVTVNGATTVSVNSPIAWTSNASLTFSGASTVNINNMISAPSGGTVVPASLALNINTPTLTGNFTADAPNITFSQPMNFQNGTVLLNTGSDSSAYTVKVPVPERGHTNIYGRGADITIGGLLGTGLNDPSLVIDTPGNTVTLALGSGQLFYEEGAAFGLSDTSTLVVRDIDLSATTSHQNDISILGTSGGLVATYPHSTGENSITPFVGSLIQSILNRGSYSAPTLTVTAPTSLTVGGEINASFSNAGQVGILNLSAPTVTLSNNIYNSSSNASTNGQINIHASTLNIIGTSTIQTTALSVDNIGYTSPGGSVNLTNATLNITTALSVTSNGAITLPSVNNAAVTLAGNTITTLGALGGTTALTSFAATASGANNIITLGGNITASGSINMAGALQFATSGTTITSAGNLFSTNTPTSYAYMPNPANTNTGVLNLSSPNAIKLNPQVAGSNAVSIQPTGAGILMLQSGTFTNNQPLTLGSIGSGPATIGVSDSSGLTMDGSGALTINRPLVAEGETALTLTPTGALTLAGTNTTAPLFSSLTLGRVDQTTTLNGDIQANGNIDIAGDLQFTTSGMAITSNNGLIFSANTPTSYAYTGSTTGGQPYMLYIQSSVQTTGTQTNSVPVTPKAVGPNPLTLQFFSNSMPVLGGGAVTSSQTLTLGSTTGFIAVNGLTSYTTTGGTYGLTFSNPLVPQVATSLSLTPQGPLTLGGTNSNINFTNMTLGTAGQTTTLTSDIQVSGSIDIAGDLVFTGSGMTLWSTGDNLFSNSTPSSYSYLGTGTGILYLAAPSRTISVIPQIGAGSNPITLNFFRGTSTLFPPLGGNSITNSQSLTLAAGEGVVSFPIRVDSALTDYTTTGGGLTIKVPLYPSQAGQSLTLNPQGSLTLAGTNTSNILFSSLALGNADQTTTLDGNISAAGNISFAGPVISSNTTPSTPNTITSTENITFGSAIQSVTNGLSLSAPSGTISLQTAGTTAGVDILSLSAQNITLNGNITTTGAVDISGALQFSTSETTITSTGGSIFSTLTPTSYASTGGAGTLNFSANGSTTVTPSIVGNNSVTFDFTAGTPILSGGNVSSSQDLTLQAAQPIQVGGLTSYTTTNNKDLTVSALLKPYQSSQGLVLSPTGSLTLAGTVTTSPLFQSLTLGAVGSATILNGSIGASNIIFNTSNITLNAVTLTGGVIVPDGTTIGGTGNMGLAGSITTGQGTLTLNLPITLAGNSSITAPGEASVIAGDGVSVTGNNYNFTLTSTGSGTNFNVPFIEINVLSLVVYEDIPVLNYHDHDNFSANTLELTSTHGNIIVDENLTTTKGLSLLSPVLLTGGAPITFTNNAGNLTFGSTINWQGTASNLTIEQGTGGDIVFNSLLSANPSTNITINGPSKLSGTLNASETLTINGPATLTGNLTLMGNVIATSTIDGLYGLTVNDTAGFAFSSLGSIAPLASFTRHLLQANDINNNITADTVKLWLPMDTLTGTGRVTANTLWLIPETGRTGFSIEAPAGQAVVPFNFTVANTINPSFFSIQSTLKLGDPANLGPIYLQGKIPLIPNVDLYGNVTPYSERFMVTDTNQRVNVIGTLVQSPQQANLVSTIYEYTRDNSPSPIEGILRNLMNTPVEKSPVQIIPEDDPIPDMSQVYLQGSLTSAQKKLTLKDSEEEEEEEEEEDEGE